MLSGIYKIENLINKKVYIGQSMDILNRWQEHIESSNNNKRISYNYPLQIDIRKFGLQNFSFSILEINLYDKKELLSKEYYYIQYYQSNILGYNQNSGYDPLVNEQNKRKSWTIEEVEKLKELISEGLTQQEISERLQRSRHSINTKISRLGIGPRQNNPWTPEKEQELIKLRNQGLTQQQVGERLNFSKEAIKKRWHDKFIKIYGEWKNINGN